MALTKVHMMRRVFMPQAHCVMHCELLKEDEGKKSNCKIILNLLKSYTYLYSIDKFYIDDMKPTPLAPDLKMWSLLDCISCHRTPG